MTENEALEIQIKLEENEEVTKPELKEYIVYKMNARLEELQSLRMALEVELEKVKTDKLKVIANNLGDSIKR